MEANKEVGSAGQGRITPIDILRGVEESKTFSLPIQRGMMFDIRISVIIRMRC
jgi:hypothetical protein